MCCCRRERDAGNTITGGFSLGKRCVRVRAGDGPRRQRGALCRRELLSDVSTTASWRSTSPCCVARRFYSTAIMTHRKQDVKFEVGAWGVITSRDIGLSTGSARTRPHFLLIAPSRSKNRGKVPDAPQRDAPFCSTALSQGPVRNKFIYGQDHARPRAWGWSSVGPGGLNRRRVADDEHGVQRRRPAEARRLGLPVQ